MKLTHFKLHSKAIRINARHCAAQPLNRRIPSFLQSVHHRIAHSRSTMPLLTTLATTAILTTLGSILYSHVRQNELIADIEQQVKHSIPARCHRVVIVEPSDSNGIWSASVYWTANEEKILQAFATTEGEALVRLRRIVKRAFKVESVDRASDSEL